MVTFPYNTTDFAFTLNDVFINFSTSLTDTYFDLEVTINYFEFFSAVEKTKVLEYKIPLVNQAQEYNVGRKIDRYLASLNNYDADSKFQYQVAKVSFLVKEINISDGTVEDTITLDNVKFIAGIKPTSLSNNLALLLENTTVEKVGLESFVNTPFLITPGEHTIEVYKNNVVVASTDITATENNAVYLHKFNLADHEPSIADVFKVKLKDFAIYREVVVDAGFGKDIMLVFLDKFKLPRSFTCFGEFSYPIKYNQITHNYKRNLEEVLEVVSTEKVKTLNIDTGSLFKYNSNIIDEINDCKKAFLIKNDAAVLELAPIASKLVLEDSTEENYSYQLKFQINKANA